MGYVYCVVVLSAWAAAALVYRYAATRRSNHFLMVGAMGLVALVLDLLWAAVTGVDLTGAHGSQIIAGVGMGLAAATAIPAFLAALARGELAITWTVSTLAFALTSSVCIFYPGEPARASGLVGLAMAAAAVALLGADMRRRQRSGNPGRSSRGWGVFIAIAFLANAVTMYCFRLASHFAPDDGLHQKLAFLAVGHGVFGAAGIAIGLWRRRTGRAPPALSLGALVGALLFVGGLFSMLALSNENMPGHVFFPIATGGSAVMVTLISVVFLAERPGWLGRAGLAAGVAALVLLGWVS